MAASIRFVYIRTLKVVEERFEKKHVSGMGDKAVMRDETIGWYATFREDPVAVFLGYTEPALRAGDRVRLTLEKVGP